MILGAVIVGLVGLLCAVLGWLIWKKQKIALFHDYHYKNVSEEDKKAFCAVAGKGIFSIGTGLLITALLLPLTNSAWCFLIMAIGFGVGIGLLIYAGGKYNRKR